MRKALITTYCTWTSYGSILQAYALKMYLKQFQWDSYIVTDSNDDFNVHFHFSNNLKSLFCNVYACLHNPQNIKRYNKNRAFIEKNIDVKRFSSYHDIKRAHFNADIYLAGSDQIFHPDLCKPLFFLDFAPEKSKKVSYAASMGVTTVKDEKKTEFQRLINNFDYLSVRESDNIDIIKEYTEKDVQNHIDPTFLLSPSEWKEKAKKYPIKGKYILVYPLYWDSSCNFQLKALKKRTGYNIVSINTGFSKAYSDVKIFDAGVEEFLWLFDNAEAVVTSSFHGVALSAILNKDFAVVVNPKAPSRINSLLNTLELKPLTIDELMTKHIDYAKVNENIKKEQKRSFEYLNRVLQDE